MKRAQILRPHYQQKESSPFSSVAVNVLIVCAIVFLLAWLFDYPVPALAAAAVAIGIGALWIYNSIQTRRESRELAFQWWLKSLKERAYALGDRIDLSDPYWRESFENKTSTYEALSSWRRNQAERKE